MFKNLLFRAFFWKFRQANYKVNAVQYKKEFKANRKIFDSLFHKRNFSKMSGKCHSMESFLPVLHYH